MNKTQASQTPPQAISSRLKKELFPQKIKFFTLSWVFFLLVFLIFIYTGYQVYRLNKMSPKKSEVEITKIDLKYITKLNELESFGDIPSPDEPGYGKNNPFGGI